MMSIVLAKETFLPLVRLVIGNAPTVRLPNDIDWNVLEDLAERQGLLAMVSNGIEKLPEDQRPPKACSIKKKIFHWMKRVSMIML